MHETLLRLGARLSAGGARGAARRRERDLAVADPEALKEKIAARSSLPDPAPLPAAVLSSPADRILALERSVAALNARVLAEAEAKEAAAAEADALRAALAAERAGRRVGGGGHSSVAEEEEKEEEEQEEQGQSAVAAAEAAAVEAEEAAAAAVGAAEVAAAAAASAAVADGSVVVTASAKKKPKRPVSAAAAAKHSISNDAIDDLSARVAALGALLASSSRND